MRQPANEQPGLLADVLFAAEDARLVIRVDPSLAHDDAAAADLTAIAALSSHPLAAVATIRDLAEDLDWTMSIEVRGVDRFLSIGRSK